MDLLAAIKDLGLPTAVAAVLLHFLYKAALVIYRDILQPIAKSFLSLIEDAKSINKTNSDTLQNLTSIFHEQSRILAELAHETRKNTVAIEHLNTTMRAQNG